MDDSTLRYLQSVLAGEFGITAALLFQIGFAARRGSLPTNERLPDADHHLALALAVIVGVTVFGSLLVDARRREPGRAVHRDDRPPLPVPLRAPEAVTGSIRAKDP
jgi:hypothetical protein